MKPNLNILLFAVLPFVFAGCGVDTPSSETDSYEDTTAQVAYPADFDAFSLQQKVEFFIENDLYTDAFDVLRGQDETDQQIRELKIAAHMTYGLYLTYGSLTDMRTRMPEALRHYRKVVELDPENTQAKAEIDQIEGIYRSLNREIPQGVAE
jgi:hypothetical protein